MRDKVITAKEAADKFSSGMTVMVGGFGLIGSPLTVLKALEEKEVADLTVISNNVGEEGVGLGIILQQGKIGTAIGSYFTSNREAVRMYNENKLRLQLLPQGTLSEAIRAGGAGIPAFYTSTSAGTKLAEGKEKKVFDGKTYVLQKSLKADIAIIKAHKADEMGNLTYYKTARNFNPLMATAANTVIVEVDEIVPAGSLDPEAVITPHLFIDYIVQSKATLLEGRRVEYEL
ncbi:succinyl-CoA--3-ketoacid-CoA transferase [Sporosarcina sp. P2]|uniref:CoA transferase subunit A n=1 Tax=unclassified Sporosarcina TaxID=2647733 RepID=UPI000C163DD7|nr:MULTISPECIES: CoA transferase subunit A [unclassified Sporosarcina]PIC70211.1 succinyl-CoA--3-ketoacid-CoA transferase [Sporosarcina sp. P16b]PID01779.1 succinyl-CoA--3-ketoacid-CoA transferase [Sporosarcina sp. P2]